jgi:hypothetical protein
MSKCRKCHTLTSDCPACKGGTVHGLLGKLTCSKCNNTGQQCPTHGAHWQ